MKEYDHVACMSQGGGISPRACSSPAAVWSGAAKGRQSLCELLVGSGSASCLDGVPAPSQGHSLLLCLTGFAVGSSALFGREGW